VASKNLCKYSYTNLFLTSCILDYNSCILFPLSTVSPTPTPLLLNTLTGNINGNIAGQPIPLARVQADLTPLIDGQLDWTISFGNQSQANVYLPLLPSLSLPFGWLTASENPPTFVH